MREFEEEGYSFRVLPDGKSLELIAWDYHDFCGPGEFVPLFIPSMADGKQLVSIGENAFAMPTSGPFDLMTGRLDGFIGQPSVLVVPETVKQLKARAFCRDLPFPRIFLPKSLAEIDEHALDTYETYIGHEGSFAETFVRSHELKHMVFPGEMSGFDLPRFEAYAQVARSSLSAAGALILPASEEKLLLTNALDYFSDVVWPDGTSYYTWIDGMASSDGVLSNCRHDTRDTYYIPEGVREIGPACFYMNQHVQSVFLPKSLKIIQKSGFGWCKRLSQVAFPPYLQRIGASAFENCESLRSVHLPASVEVLEGTCFGFCRNLETASFQIPGATTDQGELPLRVDSSVFARCALKRFHFPARTVSIAHSIFAGCEQLEAVYLPPGIKEINEKAFRDIPVSCLFYVRPGSFAERWLDECGLRDRTRFY